MILIRWEAICLTVYGLKPFLSLFIACFSVCFKNSNEKQVRIPFMICSDCGSGFFFFLRKCDEVQKEGALAGIGVLYFIQGLIIYPGLSEFPLPTRWSPKYHPTKQYYTYGCIGSVLGSNPSLQPFYLGFVCSSCVWMGCRVTLYITKNWASPLPFFWVTVYMYLKHGRGDLLGGLLLLSCLKRPFSD